MSDTISKSELLEWTEKCKSDAASSASDYDMGMLRAFQMIEEQIQSGRFDTEGWISVKDRLPDRGGKYLTAFYDHEPEIAKFKDGKFHLLELDSRTDSLEWRTTTYITNWMPLPKPPKGEEQKDE